MLATGTTLGCGLSICLAVFPAETQAVPPQPVRPVVYRFDDWTMVVQPAQRPEGPMADAPALVIEPRVSNTSRIELTSHQTVPPPPQPAGDDVKVDAPIDAVLISPGNTHDVAPAPCPTTPADGIARAQSYQAIYDSIPFSRAEYEANPSYRHDATMEFLFGQMRPTVIHRQQRTRVDINMPSLPYSGAGLQFNRYGLYNRWSPYMYPPYRW